MRFERPGVSGTRSEIAAELRNAAEGWQHHGKPELAAEAAIEADRVSSGEASSAQVGHVRYSVTD